MTGGQIVALIFAILLLLPGGCSLVFGISGARYGHTTGMTPAGDAGVTLIFLTIAAVTLSLAGLLFWVAFRRQRHGRCGSARNQRTLNGSRRYWLPTRLNG
jgi:membrane protein implicated in regulation of membrane protease activity